MKGKRLGRKDGRGGTREGDSSDHVVWSRVRGKPKGSIKQREASMAEGRMEVAVIKQRKKGLPVRERRLGESWMSISKSLKLRKRGRD